MPQPSPPHDWRQPAWIAALMLGSLIFTFGFACATPLAAFAAFAALNFRRPQALALITGVWLINQIVGFGVLHYPLNAPTLAWGAILGGIAIAATLAAPASTRRIDGLARAALCFLAAFVVYEGGLYLVSVTVMGGAQDYTAAIVARIFEINALAFVGLMIVQQIARAAGLDGATPRNQSIPYRNAPR